MTKIMKILLGCWISEKVQELQENCELTHGTRIFVSFRLAVESVLQRLILRKQTICFKCTRILATILPEASYDRE